MRGLWERLESLHAIVDTARADDLERQPEAVRILYEPYADAYFVIEAVKRAEQRLISELRAGKPVTGYLSADYGYGKTATAIYLWKRCLDSEIVAVPPFLFRQLGDIMLATKGWLAYLLEHTKPNLTSKLEDAYRLRAGRSVEELARDIAKKQGISEAKSRAIVQDHIAQRQDITTTQSVLDFLRDATNLAKQAGFKGLIIFADEVQHFLPVQKAGVRGGIQTLSELVKGIRAAANESLALILCMPVHPTEAAIEEQAGDVMHRMRERGTALQMQDAYGSEFPSALWTHLIERFGDGRAKQAVEQRTLDSLGQLCARKDLSNGPRTVINAFKRVAVHYQETHRPYTTIDLMDDYLQGHIVFEGSELKLTGTIRRLMELPSVQGNAERQNGVKLLAAFPRGVDKNRAGELYAAIQDLADKEQWLGEHITQLAEGYALVGLQEKAEVRPLCDVIVRDFRRKWHHIWDENSKAKVAATGFFQEMLPMLFPRRAQGQYANFSWHRSPDHDNHGVAYLILEGSFERLFSRFPDRRLSVSVTTEPDWLIRFQLPEEDLDLDFRFFLDLPDDAVADKVPTRIETANQDRRVDFHLNMKRTFGSRYPEELKFLEDIMSPDTVSPMVLLGLSMRMWGWVEEHPDMSEADHQIIEAHRRALHRNALQLLLPDAEDPTRMQANGITVSGAEQRLVESVFEAKCAELYPNYKPLMVTKEWKNLLRRYRDVLGKRPLAERRGREPFTGTKAQIASVFEWSHTVFESQSRNLESMGLLEVQGWHGRGDESEATLLFKDHPLETLLRDVLERQGKDKAVTVGRQKTHVKCIEVSRLQEVGRKSGYLSDEVDQAVDLLALRQHVERNPDGTVQTYAGRLDARELAGQAKELNGQLEPLMRSFGDEVRAHQKLLAEAMEKLQVADDEIALDAAQRALQGLRHRLDQFIESKGRELTNQLAGQETELDRRRGELSPPELGNQITGAVDFVRQVDDRRKELMRNFRELSQKWNRLAETLTETRRRAEFVKDAKTLCDIAGEQEKLKTEQKELDGKLEKLRPYLAGLERWRAIVAKASGLRDRVEPDSDLRRKLDDALTSTIIENFTSRRLESLLDWERFEAEVGTIENQIGAEESRGRNEFHRAKERYEGALRKLMSQPIVQATFDPTDSEQSYQVLYQGVLRKLQDFLREQEKLARHAVNQFDYLINEREIKAGNERNFADRVLKDLKEAEERLNQEVIKDFEAYEDYCTQLEKINERFRNVQEKLNGKRTEKEPPTDEEKRVLEFLTSQRVNLENLRRDLPRGPIKLDDLFEQLKRLYRKGHIEIEVRKRD